MTDWTTFKGFSWGLVTQPDKWGYLNNPRWTSTPEPFVRGGEHDYSGRENEEPQIWSLPPPYRSSSEDSVRHHQCGHWHLGAAGGGYAPRYLETSVQFFQEAVDTYKGKIAMVGQLDAAPGGIAAVIYEDGDWWALGGVHDITMYAEPNTCRISGDYTYCFCSFYDYGLLSGYNYLGIFRFAHDEYPMLTIAWKSESGGVPYYVDDHQVYNTMDVQGGRVACIARVMKEGGVALNKFQIKVSKNHGETFDTTWTFPDVTSTVGGGGYWDRCQLRMSEDGIVWVAYLRSAGAGGDHMIEVWKSNSAMTNWTKVWETDFYADLVNHEAANMIFDVSEVDGQYIMVRLNYSDYQVIYESRDYGVSFSTHASVSNYPSTPRHYAGKGIANGSIVLNGAKIFAGDQFYRSSDYGASFGLVDPSPIPLHENYVDEQKYHSDIVHCECGESFYPAAPSDDFISVLLSRDLGLIWGVLQSPLPSYIAPGQSMLIPLKPVVNETIIENGVTTVIITNSETKEFAFPQGLFEGLDYEDPRWTYFWF